MLGLPSTPGNPPTVLTESLHPKGRIVPYHYHLYALTGLRRDMPLVLQQKHKKQKSFKDRGMMALNQVLFPSGNIYKVHHYSLAC